MAGCFPCFESKETKKTNHGNEKGDCKEEKPMTVPSIEKFPTGDIRLKTRSNSSEKKESLQHMNKVSSDFVISAKTFQYQELVAATRNFRPECLLGEGGFGRVYKGQLETGQVVAIKQLDRDGLQGNREFLVEVLMLSLLSHPNLVNLVGYCAEGDQRLLVYELMPLGSLEDHLHELSPEREALDWITRMKIAAGAAKGLEYLHDKASPPVIYRDFKSANILLGEGFHPKLSDFGLAKLGPTGDQSHVSTRVMGTYGYCAPEYAMTGQLTTKSDVYSFGIVLLELVTGRWAIDNTKPHGEQNLVSWARPMFNDRKKLSKLADPRLQGRYPARGLYQALAIAFMCIQEEASSRPRIADVVTALSYLASQAYEAKTGHTNSKHIGERTSRVSDEGSERALPSKNNRGEPVQNYNMNCEKEDSPRDTLAILNRESDRERAVAEAKVWGENWRDKMRATITVNDDTHLNTDNWQTSDNHYSSSHLQ